MVSEFKNEEAIFDAALGFDNDQERAAYLQKACGDDFVLLHRVEALLKVHGSQRSFLEQAADSLQLTLELPVAIEGPGTAIDRYKLLEKIGEGGMAVVYMAEQQHPVRRRVALKIIKLGMDTKQVIARFEAERQALALMDHPNVAKIFDGGTTDTGRPYFVMELVRGVSITEYCDTNRLSPRERLELFMQVCQAVQHAHTKGIIHRDLKPSNVMVTLHDSRPVPKIIDFGIAKATNQRLTEKTLFTRYAQIIGTPEYMSPEQAQLSGLDVDTRTDIYSLGVLLYELLTGTTPFGEEELRQAGYLEMQRVIREQDPVKPSTKLSTLGETLTGIAKCRNSTPEMLRRAIRGDLDWIVMKSIEKDRVRRYETASSLAEDIRRHLEHEPILARSPSATYRLHKLLRKHRSGVLVAIAAVVVAAAVGVVLSLWNRDRLQLEETQGVRDQGILSQAREQYAKAERDAALVTIGPILQSKHVGPEARLLQATILVDNRRSEEAVTVLNGLRNERQEIAGATHSLLARILWENQSENAERLKEIEEHRRNAEALLPETAEAYFLRAMTAITVKDQLAALDKALQLDPDHYESLRQRAFTYYASRKYERMREDALGMTYLRRRDPLGYSLRAIALRELGKHVEAIAEYDRAMALTPKDSPQYLDLSIQRCETLLRMGDYEHVIADTRASLMQWPDKPVFQHYLFCAQTARGDYNAAREVFHQIIRSDPESRVHFEDWCAKYVFDTLAAGRSWHPAGREPVGAAFLPLVEAEETYHSLSAKARPVVTNGFSAQWSPDGSKLAFSLGVYGYSGIALFDPATKETDLLIAPGRDPAWSPDGKYIAFVRDRQVLRLAELAMVERRNQNQASADEEVWVVKADGTQPRRLARGHWPSWSADSGCVYYYYARLDSLLYSVSMTDPDAQPKPIVRCSSFYPSLSPDARRLAYVEGASLKIKDLTSQSSVAEWKLPFATWGGAAWSPTGDELCLSANASPEKRAGLWLCRFERPEPVEILDGEVDVSSWSRQAKKLVFNLGPPFFEVWTADLDPNVSIVEALGPTQTANEHFQELADLWTRRIKADPADPENYAHRAACHRSLHDDAKLRADARRYWAALHPGLPADFRLGGPWSIMYVIDGPFDCQLVVFLERQEDRMQLLRIAFGQKGRCEMKLFEIPLVVTSLLGFCFLPDSQVPAARADFTFGKRVDLGPAVNSPQNQQGGPTISRNGLELYFWSDRPGGYGGWYDIWVSKRASLDDPWGPAVNPGPGLNGSKDEAVESISSDGLTLYVTVNASGRNPDMYTATRPTTDAPWGPLVNMGPVLNSGYDAVAIISPDDLELYFLSGRWGGLGAWDLYVSTRATRNDPWGPPVNLGPTINTAANEVPGGMSPDGLSLFILSDRPGGFGGTDTWMTHRPYKGGPWSEPVNLGPSFNTPNNDALRSISGDGRWAYIDDWGQGDMWMTPIIPPLISTVPEKQTRLPSNKLPGQ